MTREEALNTLMKMRAWRKWGKEQKEEERPEMPEQKEVDEAFDVCIKLLQSSLPSNLDEAAQKVEDYYDVGEEHGYLCCHRGDIKATFKAGAEWMAGQGDSVATRLVIDEKGRVNLNFSIDDITDINGNPKYHAGQDVIIQIRKN